MPKIVDHDERRRVIVEALWRVVNRDGAHEVSVRHVAAEAGMPKSSIGHYVGTMPQLLGLAVDQLIESVTDDIMSIDVLALDRETATDIFMKLVPIAERRRHISGVWLLVLSQAGADPEVAAVLNRLNSAVAEGIQEVIEGMAKQGLVDASRDAAREARRLHALIDGLSLQAMTDPDLRSADEVRAILRDEIELMSMPAGVFTR